MLGAFKQRCLFQRRATPDCLSSWLIFKDFVST